MGGYASLIDTRNYIDCLNKLNTCIGNKDSINKIQLIIKYIDTLKTNTSSKEQVVTELQQHTFTFAFEATSAISSYYYLLLHKATPPKQLTSVVVVNKNPRHSEIPIVAKSVIGETKCTHSISQIKKYQISEDQILANGKCKLCNKLVECPLTQKNAEESDAKILLSMTTKPCIACNLASDTNLRILMKCGCIYHLPCLLKQIRNIVNMNCKSLIGTACGHKQPIPVGLLKAILDNEQDTLVAMLYSNTIADTKPCKWLSRH